MGRPVYCFDSCLLQERPFMASTVVRNCQINDNGRFELTVWVTVYLNSHLCYLMKKAVTVTCVQDFFHLSCHSPSWPRVQSVMNMSLFRPLQNILQRELLEKRCACIIIFAATTLAIYQTFSFMDAIWITNGQMSIHTPPKIQGDSSAGRPRLGWLWF